MFRYFMYHVTILPAADTVWPIWPIVPDTSEGDDGRAQPSR